MAKEAEENEKSLYLVFHLYRITHLKFYFKKLFCHPLVSGDPNLVFYPKGKENLFS